MGVVREKESASVCVCDKYVCVCVYIVCDTPTHACPKVQAQYSKVCRTPAHQVTVCHLALLAGLVRADDLRFPRRPAPHATVTSPVIPVIPEIPVIHVRARVHSVKGQEHCACARARELGACMQDAHVCVCVCVCACVHACMCVCRCMHVSVYSSMHAWGEGERREEGGAKGTGRRVYAARSHPAQILAGNTRIGTCISNVHIEIYSIYIHSFFFTARRFLRAIRARNFASPCAFF